MRTLLYRWIKTNSLMLRNAGSLAGTTAVTSVLGFVYWWLAARLFLPEAVGLASAATSVMTLLGTLSMLGLGTLLIGELPRQPGEEGRLISGALILVGGIGGCVGIVFAIAASLVSADFQVLGANAENVGLFASGVSLTAITLVLDQALIGLLQGELQFWRNTLFAVVKLSALFVVGFWLQHAGGISIYATWVVGNLLSLIALAGFVMLKGKWSVRTYLPHWGLLRKMGPAALQHHMLNLILQTPTLVLPALVTVVLSARENAWFYVSWMVASCASLIPFALTIVLYAVSAEQPGALEYKMRLTLGLALLACVLVNFPLQFGTRLVLDVFGPIYAAQSTWSLRILGLAAFPLIIKDHYIALIRIQGRLAPAIVPLGFCILLELGLAILGAHLGGLSGLSIGWVTAFCVEAAFMFRAVHMTAWPNGILNTGNQLRQYVLHLDSTSMKDKQINEPSHGQ